MDEFSFNSSLINKLSKPIFKVYTHESRKIYKSLIILFNRYNDSNDKKLQVVFININGFIIHILTNIKDDGEYK
jgi:hypothetical protein